MIDVYLFENYGIDKRPDFGDKLIFHIAMHFAIVTTL